MHFGRNFYSPFSPSLEQYLGWSRQSPLPLFYVSSLFSETFFSKSDSTFLFQFHVLNTYLEPVWSSEEKNGLIGVWTTLQIFKRPFCLSWKTFESCSKTISTQRWSCSTACEPLSSEVCHRIQKRFLGLAKFESKVKFEGILPFRREPLKSEMTSEALLEKFRILLKNDFHPKVELRDSMRGMEHRGPLVYAKKKFGYFQVRPWLKVRSYLAL
jgi:hypothetical protein